MLHLSGVIEDPELSGGSVASKGSGDSSSNPAKSAFGKFPRIGGSLKILASDTIKTTAGTANAIASQVKAPWKSTRSVATFFQNKMLLGYRCCILKEGVFFVKLGFKYGFSINLKQRSPLTKAAHCDDSI